MTLTLALHELATNAAKYGALSNDSGSVKLNWGIMADMLTVVWAERDGPPVIEPAKTGFVTRLLERAVAGDLGGTVTLDFDVAGVVCTITAALRRVSP